MHSTRQVPGSEELAEVGPNVWRLPVTLPGHSIGHVNVYALVSDDGVLLVDAGWGTPESLEVLDDLLHRIGSSADDVRRVLLTHLHPDHCGLAGALQRHSGAKIGMHAADAVNLEHRFFDPKPFVEETIRWLRDAGAPDEAEQSALNRVRLGSARVAHFVPDHLIADGEVVEHGGWEIVALHTPGHTPGHLCFYERTTRMVFSGDNVFPHINTGPGYRPQCSANPVGDYLIALDRLGALDVDWALPGHQHPFTGFGARVAQLRDHHLERMALTRGLLSDGCRTAWDIASRIPRSRRWEDLRESGRTSAMSETFGHLVHLATRGEVRGQGTSPIQWEVVA